MSRKLALVTGASAGIGEAFARVYAGAGFDVALSARRRERLETLAAELEGVHGVSSIVVPADLSDENAPERLVEQISLLGRHVDVLVNNAGYGLPGNWADTAWEDQARFVRIMLTAPLELSHRVLPGMLERDWGRIVNIASLAGIAPVTGGHTLYGPVKGALLRFTQSLHAELHGTGVYVTAVCPGLTWSEFHDVNGMREKVNRVPGWMWQSADRVARLGRAANERNRAVTVTGLPNKLIAGLSKIMPDGAGVTLARSASRKYRE